MGRDGSPVLDHYPPKAPEAPVSLSTPAPPPSRPDPARPETAAPASAPSLAPGAAPSPEAGTVPKGLIALERPFDVDEFSQMLGETRLRVVVPREDLPEVLRRISDFMGFGIYVYQVRLHPAPEELLKRFVVELERVEFSAARGDWVPFQEKGRSESPFGPSDRPG